MGTLTLNITTLEQTQNAEDVVDMMLFKCKQEVEMLSTVTRLFYSESVSSNGICLESQSSRVQWVQRFCFRGRSDVNIGQVGDSRRTVRSLSAASKPRITQRTTRYTPSIQVEGARQIFFCFFIIFLFFLMVCGWVCVWGWCVCLCVCVCVWVFVCVKNPSILILSLKEKRKKKQKTRNFKKRNKEKRTTEKQKKKKNKNRCCFPRAVFPNCFYL